MLPAMRPIASKRWAVANCAESKSRSAMVRRKSALVEATVAACARTARMASTIATRCSIMNAAKNDRLKTNPVIRLDALGVNSIRGSTKNPTTIMIP